MDRGHNQGRAAPLWPGTSMPAGSAAPRVYIHQPAPSPLRSARGRLGWVLEFEPRKPSAAEPLIGRIGRVDPLSQISLRFPDLHSAIQFAERQGWPYEVADPLSRRIRPKSYADRFGYSVADAMRRVGTDSRTASDSNLRRQIDHYVSRVGNGAAAGGSSQDRGDDAGRHRS